MYLPAKGYAIGSSYLIRQTAWLNDEPIDDDIQFLVDGANEIVQKFAADNEIVLSRRDITISRFVYHPVDSRQRTAKTAVYNAMA